MSLSELPGELILDIASHLHRLRDLAAWSLSSRGFHVQLEAELYRDIKLGESGTAESFTNAILRRPYLAGSVETLNICEDSLMTLVDKDVLRRLSNTQVVYAILHTEKAQRSLLVCLLRRESGEIATFPRLRNCTLLDGDCRLGKGALAKTILDTGSKSTILHPIASHPVRRYTKSSWFKAIIIPSKSLHIIDCVRLPQLDEIFRLCDNPKDFAFHAPTLREHPCHSTLLVPIKDSVERLSYLYPRGPQLRWETFTALKYLHIYSRTVFNSSQTNTIRRLPPNLEVLAISVDGCSVLDYAGARSLSNLVPLWLSVPGCKLRRIELQMSSYASAFHGPLFEEFRSLGLEVVPRGHPLDEFCESDMNDFPQSLRLGDCPGDGHSEK